jgi:hypothetical protein
MTTAFRFKDVLLHLGVFLLMCSCFTKENRVPAASGRYNKKETTNVPVYIGEMYYFQETDEFYTPLFFNPDFDENETDALISMSDSVVYDHNNTKRRRVPMTVAKTAFNLTGLDSLHIYDTHHTLISEASFIRVEYVENGVEHKFIAVYHAGRLTTDPAERYYCTSDLLRDYYISGFSHRTVNDQSLNKFIIYRLKRDERAKWDITNVEVLPSRATYSVVNSSSESFITELNNNQFNVVINMNQAYRVDHIVPLPYEFNQRPLMFITYYKHNEISPETSLAVFADYQEYKLLPYNRLKIKQPSTRSNEF